MEITEKDVNAIADLAHLELTAEERQRMVKDLTSILRDIDRLNELDTSQAEPITGATTMAPLDSPKHGLMREDAEQASLPHDAAMRNAPVTDGKFFKVPKVIER